MTRTNAPATNKRCICRGCGEVFSTLSNFDRHRVGNYQDGRTCADPESVGLEIKTGPNGTWWGMPGRVVDE